MWLNPLCVPQTTVVRLTLRQSSSCVSSTVAPLIPCLPGQAVRILEVRGFSSTENFISLYGTPFDAVPPFDRQSIRLLLPPESVLLHVCFPRSTRRRRRDSLVQRESILFRFRVSSVPYNCVIKGGKTRCTAGSVVSSLYHLKDSENRGEDAAFFVFPDLSVRMEGSYRLKLSLFEVVGCVFSDLPSCAAC